MKLPLRFAAGLILSAACLAPAIPVLAAPKIDSSIPWPKADPAAVERWQAMRVGMFIHWGPVSLMGKELSWSRGKAIPTKEYDSLYKRFNPVKFNADEWVSIAKAGGMKYIVLVSKHHDGFCLWDTKLTDYNIMNTPFKRDIVKELSVACKKQGIAFGVYYSVTDWYDSNWPTTSNGKRRAKSDLDAYMKYLLGQTEELLSNYGPIVELWNDASTGNLDGYGKRGSYTIQLARRLQPNILVNDRTGAGGDFFTPEQSFGTFNLTQPWEVCMTASKANAWGWRAEKDGAKPLEECLKMVIMSAGGGGNLLLNVGPRPDGVIDPAHAGVLKEMGDWMSKNGESIYGTQGGPWKLTATTASTRKGNIIYVHVLKWPDEALVLPGIPAKIVAARVLGGGKASALQTAKGVEISVTPADRRAHDTIVVLELDSEASKIPVTAGALPKPTVPKINQTTATKAVQ